MTHGSNSAEIAAGRLQFASLLVFISTPCPLGVGFRMANPARSRIYISSYNVFGNMAAVAAGPLFRRGPRAVPARQGVSEW